MKKLFSFLVLCVILCYCFENSPLKKGTWTPLNNKPTFLRTYPDGDPTKECYQGGVANPLLLTDGCVFVQNTGFYYNSRETYKFCPDIYGSYVNGNWFKAADLPPNHIPYAIGSAVLPDGRVVYAGGEYNGPNFDAVWTSLVSIYDPKVDTWTSITPPSFLNGIGDGATVVLENGTFMVQDASSRAAALLDATTLTWTEVGTATKYDRHDEEGWTLLPNGEVLAIGGSGIPLVYTQVTTDVPGVGPFQCIPSISSVYNLNSVLPEPLTGDVVVPNPDNTACTSNVGDLNNKIVVYRRNCPTGTSLSNIEPNGALAAIQIYGTESTSPYFTSTTHGSPTSEIFLCVMRKSVGNNLLAEINNHPTMKLTLSQPPVDFYLSRSEIFNPVTGQWRFGGNIPALLTDTTYEEQGPAVLRPDGTVFAFGGVYGNTAVYDTNNKSWRSGPNLPLNKQGYQLGVADGSASLLPNGKILVASGVGFGATQTPTYYLLTDGEHFLHDDGNPNAPNECSQTSVFLLLPTGQVFVADVTTNVQIYTPADNNPKDEWRPFITEYPRRVEPGKTYKIKGELFNGLSQGTFFGDEGQSCTNYPLVRITNKDTGHVFYARTHDHSYMGVANVEDVYTYFDVSLDQEKGESYIEVIANGIASKKSSIDVSSRPHEQEHQHHYSYSYHRQVDNKDKRDVCARTTSKDTLGHLAMKRIRSAAL